MDSYSEYTGGGREANVRERTYQQYVAAVDAYI